MKLFCNINNAQGLKPLVAASISKKEITLETISLDDQRFQAPRRLPVLLLDSGTQIFSSNASTCFLLETNNLTVDDSCELLEWEVTKLQPAVAAYVTNVANGKKSDNTELSALLEHLSSKINARQFLIGSSVSAADISIWATLYPLSVEQKLASILPADVAKWHGPLSARPEFKQAISKLSPSSGVELWASNCVQWAIQSSSVLPSKDGTSKEISSKGVDTGVLTKTKVSSKPVLPESGKRNILITSALPYVNNVPHLGNIIGCVLSADVFARFCRARGHPTLYISGTDEYGTATETKAITEGMTPQQICDKYHKIHAQVYDWFNIGFDHFGRTSSKEHTEICQEIFLKLHSRGLTLTESMEQLLCQKCERYLADRFVEGECPLCGYEDARGDQCDKCGKLVNATELRNPRCKLCQQTPVTRDSTHFFLDLPKVEPKLKEWMAVSSQGWTNNASVIAHSWIKDGLKPRCITRDLKWGIPVPLDGYRDKVFYVWFDAPLGYVSMTKCYTKDWEKWWKNPKEVEYYQFMAKDNVPFHSVMFPSTQLGTGDPFTIVNHIMATEYLNYEDGKFSKSRGVGVFGSDVQDTGISADVWRFYLLFVRPESQDSSFSWEDLMIKNNSELLNNLGNFINRALMFVEKFFGSIIPDVEMTAEDKELVSNVNEELKGYVECVDKARLRDGIRHILSISRHGNQYMQMNQPWVLVKGSDTDKKRAGSVTGLSANIACLLAALLRPYMPATTDIIRSQLAASEQATFLIPDTFSLSFKSGHKIGKPAPLFSKIESSHVDSLRARFAGDQEAQAKRAKPGGKQTGSAQNMSSLQAAVDTQAEVVRKLKSETKDKSVWQPEVNKLLDLKKQLAQAQSAAPAPASAASSGDVATLEAAVAAQGEVVRKLKSETKDKSVWQPEVNKLLDLKKQLAQAQSAAPAPASAVSGGDVAAMEAAVAAQGEVVRKLKSETKEKSVWQPEVNKLLNLKKQLAQAQSATPALPTAETPSGDLAALETAITAQGEVVRKLKSEGKDKSVWQPEVNKLLELKQKYTEAGGVTAPPPKSSGKKKK